MQKKKGMFILILEYSKYKNNYFLSSYKYKVDEIYVFSKDKRIKETWDFNP